MAGLLANKLYPSSVSALFSAGVIGACETHFLLVLHGCWDLNSYHHAREASTVTPESSSSSEMLHLKKAGFPVCLPNLE